MKQILVPCDFSPTAIEAYKFAVQIASVSEKAVIVLYAIDLPVMAAGFDVQPYRNDPELEAQMEAFARDQFLKLELISAGAGVMSRLDIRVKSLFRAVREKVSEGNVELVVMGTHGSSGVNELLFGSNTERVVRQATVPVMAIRKAPLLSSIRKIVFPNSLEPDQSELVSRVIDLQRFFDATLHILWVNTPDHFVPDVQAIARLREFAESHGLTNYVLEVRSDIHEQQGIMNFVRSENADLVAMGTRGRRGFAHLLAGSIAEDVVNHIQCPIWTYVTH